MIIKTSLLVVAALAVSSAAHAAPSRHHAHPGDIVVHAHPIIKPQTYAPVGSEDRYAYETIVAQPPGLTSRMGLYGQSTLPRPFDPPGQDSPLFRF